MNQEKIGKFLFENRKKKNLTQSELAKKLKVSNYTISNWENGKSMPSYELLIPLTKELDITLSELINGEHNLKDEEPNKIVEKIINFLKRIDNNKKKKYRNIGIVLIIVGILIKVLSMIFIEFYQDYDDYYMLLSYIIEVIGISYLFYEEKIINFLLKTLSGSILAFLLFLSIDIAEIKIFKVPPRYFENSQFHYSLIYYRTPFYDVYGCDYSNKINRDLYPDIDYFIVPKTKIQDDKILEEKYCKKNKH